MIILREANACLVCLWPDSSVITTQCRTQHVEHRIWSVQFRREIVWKPLIDFIEVLGQQEAFKANVAGWQVVNRAG